MTYVLDACAVIAYLKKEEGQEKVLNIWPWVFFIVFFILNIGLSHKTERHIFIAVVCTMMRCHHFM